MVMRNPAADPPAEERDEPLAGLDCSPAAGVRADRPELAAAAAEYAEADRERPGCLPPIDLFAGPTARYVGDGSNRVKALAINRRAQIRARVRTYPTDAAALDAARRHAWAANETHGVRRTDADKHRAAREFLLTPGNADGSDYQGVKACKVNKIVVRKVRTLLTEEGRLSGEAAAGPHRYKDCPADRQPPGGQSPGGWRATNSDAGLSVVRDDGCEEPAVPAPSEPAMPAMPAAAQPATPAGPPAGELPLDACGRPVPSALVHVFAGRTRFRGWCQQLGRLAAEIEAAHAAEPWAAALLVNPIRQAKETLSGEISAAEPYVACPRCRAGEAGEPKRRKLCGGKGWGTRLVYGQWPRKDQAACEPEKAADSGGSGHAPPAAPEGDVEEFGANPGHFGEAA